MDRLKLIGIKNLPFESGDRPTENKEYIISFRTALHSIEELTKEGEETAPKIYKLKIDRVEQLMEIGGKTIRLRQGTSKSKIQRFKLEELAKLLGKGEEEFYNRMMDENIGKIEAKIIELKQ